ncbi:MAG: hypothetical protein N2Z63_08335 [Thiobacillaceae bacterium]|nr:hypothetical protein [Thiobacillaceae bacterium]
MSISTAFIHARRILWSMSAAGMPGHRHLPQAIRQGMSLFAMIAAPTEAWPRIHPVPAF